MTAFSNHLEEAVINATLRGGTYTGGAVYAALFTTAPTDAATGTEVVDSGYARQLVTFIAPVDGVTSNSAQLEFPAIVDATIGVTHWAIFDAPTDGNMLYHGAMDPTKTYEVNDVPFIPVGALEVTLD